MKNKKLLTRLFALLASLVLVLALALPCFAEDTETLQQFVVTERFFSSYSEFYDFCISNPGSIVYFIMASDSYTFVFEHNLNVSILAYFGCYFYTVNGDVVDDVGAFLVFAPTSATFYMMVNGSVNSSVSYDISELDAMLSSTPVYVYEPISISADTPVDPSTPSSDMYTNLFIILKDAVYGSDAELTGSQEYALTLISTILTYATILLPIILVICIAVWCFKRF